MLSDDDTCVTEEDWHEIIRYVGAVQHARKFILRVAQKKLGPPSVAQAEQLNAITELDRLDAMIFRLIGGPRVRSWTGILRVR